MPAAVEFTQTPARKHRPPINPRQAKSRCGGVWANTTTKSYNRRVSRCCNKLAEKAASVSKQLIYLVGLIAFNLSDLADFSNFISAATKLSTRDLQYIAVANCIESRVFN
jgi:hypothetical protein